MSSDSKRKSANGSEKSSKKRRESNSEADGSKTKKHKDGKVSDAAAAVLPTPPPLPMDDDAGDEVTYKDCGRVFIFTREEKTQFERRGFTPRVRCVECTKAKNAKYGDHDGKSKSVPTYSAAVEAKLDAWLAAKRSQNFEEADRLRSAIRQEGVEPEDARPIGYVKPLSQEKLEAKQRRDLKKVKCFNCGAKGHRSEDCTLPRGSTVCYYCGEDGHQGKDCPKAPPPAPPPDPKTSKCYSCGQMGHLSRDCPAPPRRKGSSACYVCGQEGHESRYCPNAQAKRDAAWEAPGVASKLADWTAARERKNYETADRLRAELMAVGVNPNKGRPKKG